MAYFAVIKNDEVANIIVAESLEIAQEVTQSVCVEYTPDNAPSIGDKFEETPAKKVK